MPARKKTGSTPHEGAESSVNPEGSSDEQITTVKVFKRLANTINKIARLAELSQPEVVALFEKKINAYLLRLLNAELAVFRPQVEARSSK